MALVAVLVWRYMRREERRKEFASSPNLTYFGDEPEEAGGIGKESPDGSKESGGGGLHRSPTRVNAAANF